MIRTVRQNGSIAFLVCFGFGVVALRRNKFVIPALVCLAGWAAAPIVFTNLHFEHTYYPVANNLLLLSFVAFAFAGVEAGCDIWKTVRGLTAFILVVYAGMAISAGDVPMDPRAVATKALGERMKDAIPSKSAIIATGLDWHPLLAFTSGLDIMMIPEWKRISQSDVDSAAALLQGRQVFTLFIPPLGAAAALANSALAKNGIVPTPIELEAGGRGDTKK